MTTTPATFLQRVAVYWESFLKFHYVAGKIADSGACGTLELIDYARWMVGLSV